MYEYVGEQRKSEVGAEETLWRAVIAGAIMEWLHGPLRKKREAEMYLFNDTRDFPIVCQRAGMDPVTLRARLRRFSTKGAAPQPVGPLGQVA
ncbi:MAG: hypothetical protein ACLP1Y_09225 [Candidatus Acidiferrales bacterium]